MVMKFLEPNFPFPFVINDIFLNSCQQIKYEVYFERKQTEVEWCMINYRTSLYLRFGFHPKDSNFWKKLFRFQEISDLANCTTWTIRLTNEKNNVELVFAFYIWQISVLWNDLITYFFLFHYRTHYGGTIQERFPMQ